jgi:hypothetical protein
VRGKGKRTKLKVVFLKKNKKNTRSGFCVNRWTSGTRIMKVAWGHGGDQSDLDPSFQGRWKM